MLSKAGFNWPCNKCIQFAEIDGCEFHHFSPQVLFEGLQKCAKPVKPEIPARDEKETIAFTGEDNVLTMQYLFLEVYYLYYVAQVEYTTGFILVSGHLKFFDTESDHWSIQLSIFLTAAFQSNRQKSFPAIMKVLGMDLTLYFGTSLQCG